MADYTSFKKMIVTLHDDGVLDVVWNRPEVRNAIDSHMEREYNKCLEMAWDDPRVRAVTLRGAGKIFSAGHDLKETSARAEEMARRRAAGEDTYGSLYEGLGNVFKETLPSWRFYKPLIAGVHGFVGPHANGLLSCVDFIIAAEGTKFSIEHARGLGIVPGGQYAILNRQLPMRVAYKMWMTGGFFTAEQSLQWQHCQRVVPMEDLEKVTHEWAATLGRIDTAKYAQSKRALHAFYEASNEAPNAAMAAIPVPPMGEDTQGKQAEGSKRILEQGIRAGLVNVRDAGFDPEIMRA